MRSQSTPEVVEPAYGSAALSDLLPSVLAALGVVGERDVLGLPPSRHYCVLLVDGLGWHQLRARPDVAPFLNELTRLPTSASLTAPVPSTTAASLTSLGTGLPPGRHGLVGYTCRIPGTGSLLNALRWPGNVDPQQWQPHPTIFERARAAGVSCRTLGKGEYRKSGLTLAGLRGSDYVKAATVGQRLALVGQTSDVPSLTYVYESDLDATGHVNGVGSAAWGYQLALLDRMVELLVDALPPGTTLVVTGDHGMVDIGKDARIDYDASPELQAGVDLVAGEARFRHLYACDGAAGDVASTWREVLGGHAEVLLRDEAIARHWFGPVDPPVRERLGDVLVATTDVVVEVPSVFPFESHLTGFHGSLTPAEMDVPLLVAG